MIRLLYPFIGMLLLIALTLPPMMVQASQACGYISPGPDRNECYRKQLETGGGYGSCGPNQINQMNCMSCEDLRAGKAYDMCIANREHTDDNNIVQRQQPIIKPGELPEQHCIGCAEENQPPEQEQVVSCNINPNQLKCINPPPPPQNEPEQVEPPEIDDPTQDEQ